MQWVIVTTLFCSVSLLGTEGIRRHKRQEDRWVWGIDTPENQEDRWVWGIDTPKNITFITAMWVQIQPRTKPENVTTTTTPKPKPEACQYYNPPMPDFSAPGRRISEVKCYEFIWQLKKRLDIKKRQSQCLEWQKTVHHVSSVVKGRITTPGEFPHMGAIGWKAVVGTWVFKCGSSLISPKFVLSAGHCIKASSKDSTIADVVPKIVRLGDKNIIDITYNGYPPIDVNINKIISHPQYASPKKYFDIALMELENPVEFSNLVQPACLWESFSTTELGNQATLTGWGVIESGGRTSSPELMAATVDIIDSQQCNELLTSKHNRHWRGIQEHQLCAGKLTGGVDACEGDSGGPLQVKIQLPTDKEGSMYHIIGVTSFGSGCARPNLPGVYTRVSYFIDWIEDIVFKEQ